MNSYTQRKWEEVIKTDVDRQLVGNQAEKYKAESE